MNADRCRICLQDLTVETGVDGVHSACARTLCGEAGMPSLPFALRDLQQMAEHIVRRHVSVPGVQPKLSLHLEQAGGGRLTLVDMEGEYIFKSPSETYPELPELEHVTLRMASALGLATCASGLLPLQSGEPGLIIRRMDRESGHKLAMEDLCQLTDHLTEDKYRGSLEKAGKAVRQFSHFPGLDALVFFELALFCFVTGNADMHLKNFSLLTGLDGQVRLSPAYDLVPSALLLPGDGEETALTLNGKKSRLCWADFEALGRAIDLTPRQVVNARVRLFSKQTALEDTLERAFLRLETRDRYRILLGLRFARLE